jgi:aerobic carbon-monoxide dehydrogenase medium subunit
MEHFVHNANIEHHRRLPRRATGRAYAADAASAHLLGKQLLHENITSAASLAAEQAECLSDHYASAEYRKHLVKTEVSRALTSLSAV